MSIENSALNPINVKIKLIQKNIPRSYLKKKLKVKDAAISMALSGNRLQLLEKINSIADSFTSKKGKK